MADRLIYESRKSKVFHRTEADGAAYAVKVLSFDFPTPDDISQFHNEFDIIEGLSLPGVRKAIRKTRENGRHVLIMEWVKGQSLKEAFRDKTGDIMTQLDELKPVFRDLAAMNKQYGLTATHQNHAGELE